MQHVLNKDIKRVFANPIAIEKYQREFYTLFHSIKGAKSDNYREFNVGNIEALVELGALGEVDANDQHVVQIVDWLLQYAYAQRASDIHLEPKENSVDVRLRIDGILNYSILSLK